LRIGVAGIPGPKPPEVVLSDAERGELERLVCADKTGQALVRHARVVLLAAMGYSNTAIAKEVPMDVEAVGLWRRRWVALRALPLDEKRVAERLADAPRAGHQPRLSAEQVCQIVALACEQPSGAGRPISHWSHRELADEIVRRGITDRISPRHASRLLKSGGPAATTACAIGLPPPPTPIATPRSLTCAPCTAAHSNVPRVDSAP
jgi:putative transposase